MRAVEMRCKGCGRMFGVSTRPVEAALYCSHQCMMDGPVSSTEQRDDLLVEMSRAGGMSTGEIAALFGLSRQRVHQIVTGRTLVA